MTSIPNIIIPGYLASATDYRSMQAILNQAGYPTTTVPLTRSSWLPTLGGRSVTPILAAIDQTVRAALEASQSQQVNLIAHSAGGWIGRIYLGAENYDVRAWKGHTIVNQLITLGTPHTSQERWTRKNLDFVNQTYPGAYHQDVEYICVAGKSVFGQRRLGQWLAYSSYELTCGQGDTWGDGISPITAAHLAGATNVVLEDVWHSPRSAGAWYGSETVMPLWTKYLRVG